MKTFACFLLFILLASSGLRVSGQPCAAAVNVYSFNYDGKSYEVIKEKKTWADAAACAVERGGYLVQIGHTNEQNALFDAVLNGAGVPNNYVSVLDGGGVAYVWIGATDKVNEGTWIWDGNNDGTGVNFWNGQGAAGSGNGVPVGGLYNNWGGTSAGLIQEPDDFNGNQDAAAMALRGWPGGTGAMGIAGEWNDINITNSIYFIVEYYDTGLLEQGQYPFIITPNPVKDKLSIQSRFSGIGISEVKIVDVNGKVFVVEKDPSPAFHTMDLSDLAGGLYMVCLTMDDNTRYYHKILLNR